MGVDFVGIEEDDWQWTTPTMASHWFYLRPLPVWLHIGDLHDGQVWAIDGSWQL